MTSPPDILQSLDRARVRYLLVGGYASVIHGVPRTTVDIDLALDPEEGNIRRALEALKGHGLEPETDRLDEILGQGGCNGYGRTGGGPSNLSSRYVVRGGLGRAVWQLRVLPYSRRLSPGPPSSS